MSTYTKPVKEALETVFATAESTNKAAHSYSIKAVDATYNLLANSIAAQKSIADKIIARFAEQAPAATKASTKSAATAKKTIKSASKKPAAKNKTAAKRKPAPKKKPAAKRKPASK